MLTFKIAAAKGESPPGVASTAAGQDFLFLSAMNLSKQKFLRRRV